MMKRFLCILLSILLVVTALGMTAFAARGDLAPAGDSSGTTGECTWSYKESTKTLTVSGSGAMAGYTYYNDVPWRSFDITKIVIRDEVTAIGENDFFLMTNLTEVTIGSSVKTIGAHAFAYSTKLAAVNLPDSVEQIGAGAFQSTVITTAHIPDKVKKIEKDTFSGCSYLSDVTIGSGVTSIAEKAFASCYALKRIAISGSVAEIEENAFIKCGMQSEDIYKITIVGPKGSAAQKYAEENKDSVTFVMTDDGKVIDSINLTVTAPVVGEKPDYSVKIVGEANQYQIKTDYYVPNKGWYSGVRWTDVTADNALLNRDSIFEEGHQYKVTVALASKNDYRFYFGEDGTKGFFNDQSAIFAIDGDYDQNPWAVYKFSTLVDYSKELIKKVSLAVTPPVIGETPVYSARITAGAGQYVIENKTDEANGWKKGVKWYDVTDIFNEVALKPDDVFQENHVYEAYVSLLPAEGYRFYIGDGGTKINSRNGAAQFSFSDEYDQNPYGVVKFTALKADAPPQKDVITQVGLTVVAPKIGAVPDYTAAAVSENEPYSVEDKNDAEEGWKNGVRWVDVTDSDHEFAIKTDDVFISGHIYAAYISLTPAENYRFYFGDDEHSCVINGTQAAFAFDDDNDQNPQAYLVFPTLTEEVIDSVSLTVTDPEIDAHPDYTATVPEDEERYAVMDYNDAENGWYNGVMWIDATDSENEIVMTPDSVFENGHIYRIRICLTSNVGCKFDFSGDEIPCTVNSKQAYLAHMLDDDSDQTPQAVYDFPKLTDGKPVVLLGDVDGDGVVNIFDASAIQKRIANMPPDNFNYQAADVDGDGVLTIFDASLIQKFVAGTPIAFPINQPIE